MCIPVPIGAIWCLISGEVATLRTGWALSTVGEALLHTVTKCSRFFSVILTVELRASARREHEAASTKGWVMLDLELHCSAVGALISRAIAINRFVTSGTYLSEHVALIVMPGRKSGAPIVTVCGVFKGSLPATGRATRGGVSISRTAPSSL